MTIYNFSQLEELWINNGGNPQTAAMAAAVAMAESSGNSNNRSPKTGGYANGNGADYGLWQINSRFNGGSPAYFDPVTNVKAAIRISGNGTNWRSWCTAFSDGLCGTRGGRYLGSGSPALVQLARYKGTAPGTGALPGGGGGGGDAQASPASWNPLTWGQALANAIVKPVINFIWNGAIATIGVVLLIVGGYLLVRTTDFGRAAIQMAKKVGSVGAKVV